MTAATAGSSTIQTTVLDRIVDYIIRASVWPNLGLEEFNGLSDNLKQAKLIKADGLDESYDIFVEHGLDALAGLRPRLTSDVEKLPGARILDGKFTAVQQAIGTKLERKESAAFLQRFVEDAKASGLVAELIEKHGVTGKLTVAPCA